MSSRDPKSVVHNAIAASLARIGVGRGARILVALSGGADSIAMLHALVDLRGTPGIEVAAAHLNHRLRGADSESDERFVRATCERLGVELVVEAATDLDAATPNLEERAREIRHDFLIRAARALGAGYIALAHHRDDQAETVLMRLMRGAGATGLAAMSERGPGKLIRPMLQLGRAEIRAYLNARAILHVEDSTNSSRSILRNRIRLELIPLLERDYAPGISSRLVELGREMRSIDELVNTLAACELDAMRIDDAALDAAKFAAIHPALQPVVMRQFLAARIVGLRGISRAHIDAIVQLAVDGGPSASLDLPRGWRASRQYNVIALQNSTPRAAAPFATPLIREGVTVVAEAGFKFDLSRLSADAAWFPDDLSVALFDSAKVPGSGLVVRGFKAGDRIRPLGMRGERKVKDVFIDRKLPRGRRRSFPIVTLDGEVAWLPGLARSRLALVSTATETVLRVEASQMEF